MKDWIVELFIQETYKKKLQPTDFYWEDGKMVLTESYHLRRGSCCNSGCRHCPYKISDTESKLDDSKIESDNDDSCKCIMPMTDSRDTFSKCHGCQKTVDKFINRK
jgi:hypothetical protein